MDSIVFTKYSNERDNKFKIKTSIIKNEDNILIVEKSPLTDEAKMHIDNMYKAYNLLSKKYNADLLYISKCEMNDKTAQFEYIEGETLEKRLDDELAKRNYKVLLDLIIQYKEIIYNANDIVPFVVTGEFSEIFGNVTLSNNLKASSISNIDIIFSNIIINERWNLIDYEWTYRFPVPLMNGHIDFLSH